MSNKNMSMFLKGVKKGIPILIGFLPISTAFSVVASQAELLPFEIILMSVMLLAGASQLMAVNMLVLGAGSMEIIIATFIINMRHLIMSIYVMNKLKSTSKPFKLLLAFGVTDETFAMLSMTDEKDCNAYFFGGMAAITYGAWVGGTVLGLLANEIIPSHICKSMSIALYAMFIGILMPDIQKNFKVVYIIGVSILLNVLLGLFLQSSWAVIFATLIGGIIGGEIVEKEKKHEKPVTDTINDFGHGSSNLHS